MRNPIEIFRKRSKFNKTAKRYIWMERTPVRAIVEMWRIGVSPEEIPHRLPHLTLAQVFNALSYYLDRQSEINEYIERNRIRS